jgi:propionyl-CoA synthetase
MNEPTKILDRSSGPLYKWFTDGTLNTSYNCLDRHIEAGFGALPAIHYHSAITGDRRLITYEDLHGRVGKVF